MFNNLYIYIYNFMLMLLLLLFFINERMKFYHLCSIIIYIYSGKSETVHRYWPVPKYFIPLTKPKWFRYGIDHFDFNPRGACPFIVPKIRNKKYCVYIKLKIFSFFSSHYSCLLAYPNDASQTHNSFHLFLFCSFCLFSFPYIWS
jgi:hypothetical protein